MEILAIIIMLLFTIILLVLYAVFQIKTFGMNVKDFWGFVEANQMLSKLYVFSEQYENMTPAEQVIYLIEAEKIFKMFDKVPGVLWEEEYDKYRKVLNKYRDIRLVRWSEK